MIVGYQELKQYRKKVAMVDGAFDPLHHGHVEYFARAKAAGGTLLCNITVDSYTARGFTELNAAEALLKSHASRIGQTARTGGRFEMIERAAVRADCKQYREGDRRFSVSQVEELGFTNFWKCEDALLEALEKHRVEHGLSFACLLVTDIDTQGSLLLVRGIAAMPCCTR